MSELKKGIKFIFDFNLKLCYIMIIKNLEGVLRSVRKRKKGRNYERI